MEKHTCKLCYRRFSNGRALGGHMRSHVAAAAVAATTPPAVKPVVHQALSGSRSSSDSASPSLDETAAAAMGYGLRENPRKSFRMVDPEFLDAGSSSVVQDRESETESQPRADPAHQRRRSKRQRRVPPPLPEPEPASSVSDTTPEEDVALCLMMLSRDVWTKEKEELDEKLPLCRLDDSDEDDDDGDHRIAVESRRRGRSRYRCETCRKVFRSYQALGGHRASHKKVARGCAPVHGVRIHDADYSEANAVTGEVKIHECPVCLRVFGSGQALGGHKRSHLCSPAAGLPAPSPPLMASTTTTSTAPIKLGDGLIDLNLPAPMEDEVELSAVSDADFVAGPPPLEK